MGKGRARMILTCLIPSINIPPCRSSIISLHRTGISAATPVSPEAERTWKCHGGGEYTPREVFVVELELLVAIS